VLVARSLLFSPLTPTADLLLGVVQSNILFSSYASEEQNAIVDAFERKSFPAGVYIIKQGESGDHFYVVQSGNLEIYVKDKDGYNPKFVNYLGPGAGFGELALMYNTPRAASIKTTSECVVWEIDRLTYRGILVYFKYLRNKQYMEFLRNVQIMDKKLGIIMSDSKPHLSSLFAGPVLISFPLFSSSLFHVCLALRCFVPFFVFSFLSSAVPSPLSL
jgi:CRP-like cAMP-binding protein